jgi:hypothetical protein
MGDRPRPRPRCVDFLMSCQTRERVINGTRFCWRGTKTVQLSRKCENAGEEPKLSRQAGRPAVVSRWRRRLKHIYSSMKQRWWSKLRYPYSSSSFKLYFNLLHPNQSEPSFLNCYVMPIDPLLICLALQTPLLKMMDDG